MECPYCHEENLPGADTCKHCSQDLRNLDLPRATAGLQRRLMKTPVEKAYPRSPLQVEPNSSIGDAIRRMQKSGQGCLLVLENGKLQGILTERDLLQKVAGEGVDLDHAPVRDFMTVKPVTIRATDTLAQAMNKLSVGGYRHLPIKRGPDQELIGFLSVRCVLKYIADQIS